MNIKGPIILLIVILLSFILHLIPFDFFSFNSKISDSNLKSSYPEQKMLIQGSLDVNLATADELDAIPYISSALARRIIEFRNTHNPIENTQQLLQVKGIGIRKLKTIEQYIKSF